MMSVRRIVVVGAFMALAVASVAAFGYAQTSGGTVVHACYDNNNGVMRYIDPASPAGPKACKDNETALEWNVEGIQGPQGIQGVPGPAYEPVYNYRSQHGWEAQRVYCEPGEKVTGGGGFVYSGFSGGLTQNHPIEYGGGNAWGTTADGWQVAAEGWVPVAAFVICQS